MGGKEGKPASPEETKEFYYSETYFTLILKFKQIYEKRLCRHRKIKT